MFQLPYSHLNFECCMNCGKGDSCAPGMILLEWWIQFRNQDARVPSSQKTYCESATPDSYLTKLKNELHVSQRVLETGDLRKWGTLDLYIRRTLCNLWQKLESVFENGGESVQPHIWYSGAETRVRLDTVVSPFGPPVVFRSILLLLSNLNV